MSLKTQLYEDMKVAMKARDVERLGTIRFVISVIKNVEIDHGDQDDLAVETIIRKQVKQMQEAIEQFKQGNRLDLVESEEGKVRILEAYLPKQLSQSQIESAVMEIVAQTSNPSFGTVMPQAMKALAGKADGKVVSEIVKRLLQ